MKNKNSGDRPHIQYVFKLRELYINEENAWVSSRQKCSQAWNFSQHVAKNFARRGFVADAEAITEFPERD